MEQFNADGTTMLDTSVEEHVQRFNDAYHNAAVIGKIGVVDRAWADRLVFGFNYSHMYKEIQTGVVQKVVFGRKHRKGHSLMPSLEYTKRNLFTRGLDLTLTANYNRNITQNVDTSAYRFNWLGEPKYQNGTLGEQTYQDRRSDNDNWNATLTLKYRIGTAHSFVFNHVFNSFHRENTPTAGTTFSEADAFAKLTRKNISGLSYMWMPTERWNFSLFGKYYNQYNSGPVSTSASGSTDYVLLTNTTSSLGYGAVGTYFVLKGLQAKLSYERAFRLPTNEEFFGDEDLELGSIGLKPEKSDNLNLNLSYTNKWGLHGLYAEGSLIYRNTTDYIQRRIGTYTGNKSYASYQNHGKVKTEGYTLAVRYTYGEWVSLGGNFSHLDVRDNVKTLNAGSEKASVYVIASQTAGASGTAAYLVTAPSLESGMVTTIGNGFETDYTSATTWIFFGNDYLYRLAYNYGSAGTTAAYYLDAEGSIRQRAVYCRATRIWYRPRAAVAVADSMSQAH